MAEKLNEAVQPYFLGRAEKYRAMTQQHRLRAGAAADKALRELHAGVAITYDNMAHDVEKVAERIAALDRATARARARISDRRST